MGDAHQTVDEYIVTFGPFQLNRTTRLLTKGKEMIPVRNRAMGILMALTDKAGAIVSNRELLRRVWPDAAVETGTVRVHVARLRAVLREADPSNEYVHNVTGHGYRLLVPVVRQRRSTDATVIHLFDRAVRKLPPSQPARKSNLPRPITSVLGLDRVRSELLDLLAKKRLITVAGPGGIGKTTVANDCARAVEESHADGIWWLDLAQIERPEQIWTALAAMLGRSAATAELLSETLAGLAKQSLLLVLDNCEHVIDGAARLAEGVLRACPRVKILATSREPLRASTEVVYELAGLSLPTAFDRASREALLRSPAIQLFVERAGTEFDEQELLLVEQICRRVAGNPLAIEIAAGQCRWVGLKALAWALDDEMYLSMEGQRTSHLRHQTLRASFDWSHDLLTSEEQTILRRLSELPDRFSVDRAAAAVESENIPRRVAIECLLNLARKSLLVKQISGEQVFYGMHELIRACVRTKHSHSKQISSSNDCESPLPLEANVDSTHRFVGVWQPARTGSLQ